MDAAQIMMIPVAGVVPAVIDQGTPAVTGMQSADQFGVLLEQVLGTLKNAGSNLAEIPEQDNGLTLPAAELPALSDAPADGTQMDPGMLAQLLGGYQQMVTTQQVVASDGEETATPRPGVADISAVSATGTSEAVHQNQMPVTETEVAEVSVVDEKVTTGAITAKPQESSAITLDNRSGQLAVPEQRLAPVMQETGPLSYDSDKQRNEPNQQANVSQMHSQRVTTEVSTQTQPQLPQAQELQLQQSQSQQQAQQLQSQQPQQPLSQLQQLQPQLLQPQQPKSQQSKSLPTELKSAEQPAEVRTAGGSISSAVTAEITTENKSSTETEQPVVVTAEPVSKNNGQSVAQFRFSQSADVTTAAVVADGQDPSSGSGKQGVEKQIVAKVADLTTDDEIFQELKADPVVPGKLSDPVIPGAVSPKVVTAEHVTAPEMARQVQHEQVTRQVAERLASHEVKSGNDQISFRLSPEHLGTIQMNFKMEDQRLKLEIIAENRGVRDALLQQADDLKESLARQNIKVDSFDVTTANGNSTSQQQRDWRQMAAEQRQYQPQFMSNRNMTAGSRPEETVRYFAQQYNSTIDVRF